MVSRITTLDFITIMVWLLIILLAIIAIRLYLNHRKTSKKFEWIPIIEEPQQELNTIEQMKTLREEKSQEYVDIRNKVDKIIGIDNV